MKRILLSLLLCCAFMSSNAQTYYYRTTSFAYKTLNDRGRWTDWSDWINSNILVSIDWDNDVVKIYSPVTQIYTITEYVRNYTDISGGQQIEFKFIDQDYDRGIMRLRIERSGNSQIYIDFADIMWVYNIIKR